MSAVQVQRMAAQVAGYVTDCLSAERQHHETIAALADDALDTYDGNANWPAH